MINSTTLPPFHPPASLVILVNLRSFSLHQLSSALALRFASLDEGEASCEVMESDWGCDCSNCECGYNSGPPDFTEDDDYDSHVAKCNQCLYQGKDYCIEENVCITRGSTGCER